MTQLLEKVRHPWSTIREDDSQIFDVSVVFQNVFLYCICSNSSVPQLKLAVMFVRLD